jgi:hypothetical protein
MVHQPAAGACGIHAPWKPDGPRPPAPVFVVPPASQPARYAASDAERRASAAQRKRDRPSVPNRMIWAASAAPTVNDRPAPIRQGGAISQGRWRPPTLTHCDSYCPTWHAVSVPVTRVARSWVLVPYAPPDAIGDRRLRAPLSRLWHAAGCLATRAPAAAARCTSWPACQRPSSRQMRAFSGKVAMDTYAGRATAQQSNLRSRATAGEGLTAAHPTRRSAWLLG